MKQFCILFLLVLFSFSANAQKAYETIVYNGKLPKVKVVLTLADGYILGSEIKTTDTATGKVSVFLPEEKNGTLHFESTLNASYFVLTDLTAYVKTLPKKIKACHIYQEGNKQQSFTLYRVLKTKK